MNISALVLLIASLTLSGFCHGAEKVKLTGEQLSKQLAKHWTYSGTNVRGYVFMVVSMPDGARELYWHNGGRSDVWTGRGYVKGDQICVTYEEQPTERCSDVFRMPDGSLERWQNGNHRSTWRTVKED